MMRFFVYPPFILFSACASAPSTVLVPVARTCAVDVGPAPAFVDTKEAVAAAENIAARVDLILAGRLMRDRRIDELEAALSGCRD